VLLAGELAFNPERVLALEERGHRLFGSWTGEGLGAHTIGPLPFGHVTDVADPRDARPDVVYALLNWRAVRHAHAVRERLPDVPFVWHFKEAPQACVRSGTWPLLVDLVTGADRVVLATDEERDWFDLALPGRLDPERTSVLDGDLPKADWFAGERSAAAVGRGRRGAHRLRRAAARHRRRSAGPAREGGIHVHLHGQVVDHGPSAGWKQQVEAAQAQVPGYVHLHPKVEQPDWLQGAQPLRRGWLHRFTSSNGGDLRRAVWDDLNAPARIPTYACAGLPMLQSAARAAPSPPSGCSARPASCTTTSTTWSPACTTGRAHRRAEASWAGRDRFTFDAHADELVRVLQSARG
jgi:hypothetical protein